MKSDTWAPVSQTSKFCPAFGCQFITAHNVRQFVLLTGIISSFTESCAANTYTSHCYVKLMLTGESLNENEVGSDFGSCFKHCLFQIVCGEWVGTYHSLFEPVDWILSSCLL